MSSLTVCLFAGPLRHPGLFKEPEDQLTNFKLDNWINFNLKIEVFWNDFFRFLQISTFKQLVIIA